MDLNEPDPAKGFKYVYFQAGGTPAWAMTYRHSPDGVHWSEPQWRSGQRDAARLNRGIEPFEF